MPSVFGSEDPSHGSSAAADYGIHHILDANGFELALTGLGIVFVALAFISLFISLLPHAMSLMGKILPEPETAPHIEPKTIPTSTRQLDPSIVAAIGYAMHESGRGESKN
jgi:Na+-transporting methylmalonyl-CoA/oxaloacetate decarboxylase gamma subunit